MAYLIDQTSFYCIQGMTGKEGQRALEWMQASGATVLAGVTPGKGGQEVAGVPVFNTMREAVTAFSAINVSSIYVPPQAVLTAAFEAIDAGIEMLHIIGEGVPSLDTARILERAQRNGTRLVGPSSIGVVSPGKSMVGQLGGGELTAFLAPNPESSDTSLRTGVSILSKSGGMANTVAHMLTQAGIPQSTIVSIGGDRLIGTTFADLLPEILADDETRAVVIIGEIGGSYEELFAQELTRLHCTKPVVACISGLFAETLPQGVAFGHAGAIVSTTTGTRSGKLQALEAAGVHIAQTLTEVPTLLQRHAI